jgi:hypothetical protein
MSKLVRLTIAVPTSDQGVVMAEALAYAATDSLVVVDGAQFDDEISEDRRWRVTHRTTGRKIPETQCATREEAIKRLDALLALRGWDEITVAPKDFGDVDAPIIASPGIKSRLRSGVEAALAALSNVEGR